MSGSRSTTIISEGARGFHFTWADSHCIGVDGLSFTTPCGSAWRYFNFQDEKEPGRPLTETYHVSLCWPGYTCPVDLFAALRWAAWKFT